VVQLGQVDPAGVDGVSVVPLATGPNELTVTIESCAGNVLATATRTVVYDPDLTTLDRNLLYVDAVPGDAGEPGFLDGTVVIDVDAGTILGYIGDRHVRGISPDGREIYMHDNTVVGTEGRSINRWGSVNVRGQSCSSATPAGVSSRLPR